MADIEKPTLFDNDINFLLLFAVILAITGFILKGFVDKAKVEGLALYSLATFILMITAFALVDRQNIGKPIYKVLFNIFFGSGLPIVIFLALLIWTLKIVVERKDKIYEGKMPSEFYNFLSVSTGTFLIEILLIYNFVSSLTGGGQIDTGNEQLNKIKSMIASQISSFIILATVINFVIVSIISIMSKYYVTDG